MNKPAPKEPSMDEILSSIRQIIADDDAASVLRRPSFHTVPDPMEAMAAEPFASAEPFPSAELGDEDLNKMLDDVEPLALSSSQIVADAVAGEEQRKAGLSFEALLADTESLARGGPRASAAASEEAAAPEPADLDEVESAEDEPEIQADELVMAEPERERVPVYTPPAAAAAPRPQPNLAQAAPMPDPTLSADLANQLLEPATKAAVQSSFKKLNGLGLGNASTTTIEDLIRDMLRPMLKEWLDEYLPSVVERMVEREISRISRGD